MQAQRADWAGLVERLLTVRDGRERFRAQWLACCEVVDNPEWYEPLPFDSRPPLLDHLKPQDVLDRGVDQKAEKATALGLLYGGWRAHVTEVEARNAARLQTLAVTLQTLADLHRKSTDPDAVSKRTAQLGLFIEGAWRVSVPLSGDVRTWASRITRRYDLLPLEWRAL